MGCINIVTLGLGRQGFWYSILFNQKTCRNVCSIYCSQAVYLSISLARWVYKLVTQPFITLALGRSNSVLICDLQAHWNEATMEISFIVGTKSQNLNLGLCTLIL